MSVPSRVADEDFARVVRSAPLVSIDIIMKDAERNVLVGLRTNEPAKGNFFVPGGVIRKNETIAHAFARIVAAETGWRASVDDAAFLGVYEHFYDTNRSNDPSYGTHYVVLGYELALDHRPALTPDAQHCEFRWIPESEMLRVANIHHYTKAYFQQRPPRPGQYKA